MTEASKNNQEEPLRSRPDYDKIPSIEERLTQRRGRHVDCDFVPRFISLDYLSSVTNSCTYRCNKCGSRTTVVNTRALNKWVVAHRKSSPRCFDETTGG